MTHFGNDRLVVGAHMVKVLRVLDKDTYETVVHSGIIIPGFQVNKIRNDGSGDLWIATQRGVVKYNVASQQTRQYNRDVDDANSLPHNNVSDVVIDSRKNVWAATRKGLAKYNEEKRSVLCGFRIRGNRGNMDNRHGRR